MSHVFQRRKSLIHNLIGFMVFGVSGLSVNLLISYWYGPATVGVLNQLFAIYILASQFCVLGVQYSVLKYCSKELNDTGHLYIGLILVTIFSFVTIFALSFLGDVVDVLLDSQGVKNGWVLMLCATYVFSLNKIALSFLNGNEKMHDFANVQIVRGVFLLFAALSLFIWDISDQYIFSVFLVSELAASIYCVFSIRRIGMRLVKRTLQDYVELARTHFQFGIKGFLTGASTEANSRIDVFVLGTLFSDAIVGIYSIGALIVEGVLQVSVILRNQVTPSIARHSVDSNRSLERTLRSYKVISVGLVATLLLVTAVFMSFGVRLFELDEFYMQSIEVVYWLLPAAVIIAFCTPIEFSLSQLGYPREQSMNKLLIVILNACFAVTLGVVMGWKGVCLGIALANIAGYIHLRVSVKNRAGLIV